MYLDLAKTSTKAMGKTRMIIGQRICTEYLSIYLFGPAETKFARQEIHYPSDRHIQLEA